MVKGLESKECAGCEIMVYREETRDTRSRRRVGIAIGRAAEQLNERLGTMEGEKDIYKIVNLGKR